jgi:hypothetical protein
VLIQLLRPAETEFDFLEEISQVKGLSIPETLEKMLVFFDGQRGFEFRIALAHMRTVPSLKAEIQNPGEFFEVVR